jgi:predicted O-methyltransferase YrrM|tara:strand:+ start:962 stop:1606 length:645 start_codon:yes stop_codon:yes gene_type:complete
MVENTENELIKTFLSSEIRDSSKIRGDSDHHVLTLFSIALASKGQNYIELGVRKGITTMPILYAAYLNDGKLFSVDEESTSFKCPEHMDSNWEFTKSNSLEFLNNWELGKIDFIYIDDWHSYKHVKRELELIDPYIAPTSIILLHDLMYGGTEPYYHSDLSLKKGQWADGGPYRAVSELDPNFWEYSTLPWSSGLTILRKKYSTNNKYEPPSWH